MPQTQEMAARSTLAALGLRLSDWFERWFPDAFALALTAVAIVFVASVAMGSSVTQTAQWFGAGFWDLVAFTMQMSMIIVTGYAVATARGVSAHFMPLSISHCALDLVRLVPVTV
jgi:short-chain fatty acids transporter